MNNNRRFQVYIQNLPYSCDESELFTWCSDFGEVEYCNLKRDDSGHSRGFAFVTFTSEKGFSNLCKIIILSMLVEKILLISVNAGPLTYRDRPLNIRPSNAQMKSTNEYEPNGFHQSPENQIDYPSQENYDENQFNSHDEFEETLELIKYEQQHEIQRLEQKLAGEMKLLQEQQETYQTMQEEWNRIVESNQQLRQNLLRNVVQTFNIKQRLARELKKREKLLEDSSQTS